MTRSIPQTLSALTAALADVEADEQVRASVKELLRVLTQAVSADLSNLNLLVGDR